MPFSRETLTRHAHPSRYALLAVVVIVSLVVGEWFPLSNFPMYSGMGDSSYYFYVTDADDEPIPLQTQFGVRTARLKKIYKSNLRDLANAGADDESAATRAQAGRTTLEYLVSVRRERSDMIDYRVLRLWREDIQRIDASLARETTLVAGYDVP